MSEIISRRPFISRKKCLQSLGVSKLGRPKSLFMAHRTTVCVCFAYHRTWVVEKVRSLEKVSFMDVWLNPIITIQALLAFIHLSALHHLQPLRVMPAELLTLNLLSPLFIIFLWNTNNKPFFCKLLKAMSRSLGNILLSHGKRIWGPSPGSEGTLKGTVQNYFIWLTQVN